MKSKVESIARDLGALAQQSGLRRIDEPRVPDLIMSPRNEWIPLTPEGTTLQRGLRQAYDEFVGIASFLLCSVGERRTAQFTRLCASVGSLINQEAGPLGPLQSLVHQAESALEKQWAMISAATGAPSGRAAVVPDTQALIAVPNLEAYDYGEPVELVLVPVVLRQLDRIKDDARKPAEVRQNAREVIRHISQCRGSGSLLTGARIAGDLFLRSVATEPRMSESLRWLDPSVEDDQLIASVLEVVRANFGSKVVLLTQDLNLRNKAELAAIVFEDPPGVPPA